MIEFWLLLAKYGFLVLLYLFVFWALVVILKERGQAGSASASTSPFRIEIVSGPSSPKTFDLSGPALIGRSPHNDIRLEDNTASSRHAYITHQDGSWLIEDLGSSNGTFVNGERINNRCRLRGGDQIKIGRSELAVVDKKSQKAGVRSQKGKSKDKG